MFISKVICWECGPPFNLILRHPGLNIGRFCPILVPWDDHGPTCGTTTNGMKKFDRWVIFLTTRCFCLFLFYSVFNTFIQNRLDTKWCNYGNQNKKYCGKKTSKYRRTIQQNTITNLLLRRKTNQIHIANKNVPLLGPK